MAENDMTVSHAQEYQAHKDLESGLRSPGVLAKWPTIGLMMFLLGSLSFGALTYNLLAQGPLIQWDKTLANTLPAIGLASPPFVKSLMDAGFYIGKEGIVGLGMALGLYFIIRRYWQELAMLTIGLVGASSLFLFLTNFFDRTRPPTQIWIIEKIPGFPSGHAISSLVFYGFLAYIIVPEISSTFWKVMVTLAAFLLIVYIGFTRVFTGGHYLTDVLAGFAVGMAWSGTAFTLIEIYFKKRRQKIVNEETMRNLK